MSGLVENLFRCTAHCQQERSPGLAKDLDEVLPEYVFVVLHLYKKLVCLGVHVDFIDRLWLVCWLFHFRFFCRVFVIVWLSFWRFWFFSDRLDFSIYMSFFCFSRRLGNDWLHFDVVVVSILDLSSANRIYIRLARLFRLGIVWLSIAWLVTCWRAQTFFVHLWLAVRMSSLLCCFDGLADASLRLISSISVSLYLLLIS